MAFTFFKSKEEVLNFNADYPNMVYYNRPINRYLYETVDKKIFIFKKLGNTIEN